MDILVRGVPCHGQRQLHNLSRTGRRQCGHVKLNHYTVIASKGFAGAPPSSATGQRHECSTLIRPNSSQTPEAASISPVSLPVTQKDSPLSSLESASALLGPAPKAPPNRQLTSETARKPLQPKNILAPKLDIQVRGVPCHEQRRLRNPSRASRRQCGPVKPNHHTAMATKGLQGNPPSSATGQRHRATPKITQQPSMDIFSKV